MPKRADEHLHRLHVMVSEQDHLWLKEHLAPGELSALFRGVVKRLRGKKATLPDLNLFQLLDRENLTL